MYKGQNLLYFSEEWVDGQDLKGTKLDATNVKNLGSQISYAVEELWSYNIVHRDIKPGNIIYDEISHIYILLDMGIALDLDDKSLTKLGIPGTAPYLSPEQLTLTKRHLDFRSDLFSLGTVMYVCLTGVHPFYRSGMTQEEIIRSILTHTPASPSTIDNSIPRSLDVIIMRLLSKQPNQRYRSCNQFRQNLATV
jgi:serine/threonine-protein kinase